MPNVPRLLTEKDVHCLMGHAAIERMSGKVDMPDYFFDLAKRIAAEIGMPVPALRLNAPGVAPGFIPEDEK